MPPGTEGLSPGIQALSLAGQPLSGVPWAFEMPGAEERQTSLALTCAHLIRAGVLPTLPPAPGEHLQQYLRRLEEAPAPHDLLQTKLIPGEQFYEEEGFLLGVELRRSGEAVQPGRWFRQLSRIHPHLCGSLLNEITQFSFLRFPVYTACNAYFDITEMLAPRHDDADYWKSLNRELYTAQLQNGSGEWFTLRPVTSKQLAVAAREDPYSPPNLKRTFGHQIYQVITKPHKALDLEQIAVLAEHSGLQVLSEVTDCLEELGNLNAEFMDAGGQESLNLMGDYGGRVPSRFIVAGNARTGRESLEEELYNDYQQLIENSGEECEPLLLLPVNTQAEAELARGLLNICQRALVITEQMMALLAADPQAEPVPTPAPLQLTLEP